MVQLAVPEPVTPAWYDLRGIVRYLCNLRDTPHRIALGAGIGTFIAFTPTVGVQMLLVFALAAVTRRWFRFNEVVAALAVYITNPVTNVPIFWMNYQVGALLTGSALTMQEISERLVNLSSTGWWDGTMGLFALLGWTFLYGSLIVATVCGIAAYPLAYWITHRVQRGQYIVTRATVCQTANAA